MARERNAEEARRRYAAAICGDAGLTAPRVEAAFANVPRENFLTPPPWALFAPGGVMEMHSSDPADLYQDVLVVLDGQKGINNGQPSLHAAWLAAIDPQPGEVAIHVGAGSGYYTAILAELVTPGGHVHAYEIEPGLAEIARENLQGLAQVTVQAASAVGAALPQADIVYVNAGVTAPDPAWLRALREGGRLIFPWQPSASGGVTMLVTRREGGFEACPSLSVGFINCTGETVRPAGAVPGERAMAQTRSLWLLGTRAPDASATAIYDQLWFSSEPLR